MGWEIVPIIIGAVALVTIVLGIAGNVFERWLDHKERRMELMADKTAERAAQYVARTERLEQRVRVLERIATDRGADLAARIENLRGDIADSKESLQ